MVICLLQEATWMFVSVTLATVITYLQSTLVYSTMRFVLKQFVISIEFVIISNIYLNLFYIKGLGA